ncbi:MAG: DUF222 domain-containing protein [Acidimicrobiales bacterium]
MFDDLCDILSNDRVECLTRSQLVDRVGALRRVRGALDAYEARVVCAIDGLGDKGLDAAGVLRVEGRVSARAAGRMASTAKKLEALPKTAEALREGAITFEHAEQVARAAETVTAERADAELVGRPKPHRRTCSGKRSASGRPSIEKTTERRSTSGSAATGRPPTGLVMTGWACSSPRSASPPVRPVAKILEQRAEELWRRRRPRRRSPAEMRTLDQRMADAFVELITGNTGSAGRSDGPPHPRHQLNVIFDLNGMTDQSGRPLASLVVDRGPAAQGRARPDPLYCGRDGDAVRRTRPADLGRP